MLFALIAVSSLDYVRAAAVGAVLLALAVGVLLLLLITKRRQTLGFTVLLLVMCSMSVASYTVSQYNSSASVAGLEGSTGYISGTVVQTADSYGQYRYVVKVSGQQSYKVMLISSEELGGRLYGNFSGYVTFYGGASPNYGSDISGFAHADSVSFSNTDRVGIASAVEYLRTGAADCIDRYIGGDAGALIKGVVMGDISAMSKQIRSAFNAIGLSHTIVVSGAHLSVVMSLVMLFTPLSMGKLNKTLVTLIAMLAYMAFTGFGTSVVRAGICTAVFVFSRALLRNQSSINALGLTAIIMCVICPSAVAGAGFQLSFFATAGITVIVPAATKRFAAHDCLSC